MRKGQLTIIVIIGIALLLIVGIVLLRSGEQPTSLQAEQDAARVTQYVQSCLASTGEDVLRRMGANGGYLTTTGLKKSPNIRDTQVVEFPPQEIVLWHEIHPCEENPSGCIGNNRPPLCENNRNCPIPAAPNTNPKVKSVQEQLQDGIDEEIDGCLMFESAFQDINITKTGRPKTTAVIREENIALSLEYPLRIITVDKQTVDISSYASQLDIRLPDLYRYAIKIQETEVSVAFLENVFMHLHGVYGGIDTEIPPIRDVQLFGGSTKFWTRSAVRERIENDILPFMNFIQIINSEESFAPVQSHEEDDAYAQYADGVYRYMTIKLDNNTYPYATQFEYPGTPMFLDINGKEIIKPQKFSGGGIIAKFAGLFFTQYKFKYTLAYPVVVHLNDPAAFNGEGYQLDFGLEANIRNNYPLNVSINPAVLVGASASIDLSDPRQLVDHTYRIKAVDKYTNRGIPNATVQYECDARYYIGETDGSGLWVGRLPYCFIGGAVTLQAPGYLGTGKGMENSEDDAMTSDVTIGMWPVREKVVRIYKRTAADTMMLTPPNGYYDPANAERHRTALSPYDTVLFEVSREKTTPYDEDIPLAGMVRFGNDSGGSAANVPATATIGELRENLRMALDEGGMTQSEYDELTAQLNDAERELVAEAAATTDADGGELVQERLVDLVPGSYELQGMILYGGQIQIPAKRESRYTLEAKNFSSWVSGGAILSGIEALELTPEQVYGDDNITLYVLEQKIPATWDDLLNYTAIEEYQTYDRRPLVRPEIG